MTLMIIVVICWHWHHVLISGIEKGCCNSFLLPPKGLCFLSPREWERKEVLKEKYCVSKSSPEIAVNPICVCSS